MNDAVHTAHADAERKARRLIAAAKIDDYDTADALHRELQADWQLVNDADFPGHAADIDGLLTATEDRYREIRDQRMALDFPQLTR